MGKTPCESKNGSKTTLSASTKVSLGLLIPIVMLLAGGFAAWYDIKGTIKEVSSDRWKKVDDRIFMANFATINQLTMPPHVRYDDGDTSTN